MQGIEVNCGGSVPIALRSTDGRTVRVEFEHLTFSVRETEDFARELLDAASIANSLPAIHERHVNLLASCPLCVHEAGSQPDRLTYDEED